MSVLSNFLFGAVIPYVAYNNKNSHESQEKPSCMTDEYMSRVLCMGRFEM